MSGLKIAISGKGGVGKSTIAAGWARLMSADGSAVLAVDADPDANLAAALGVPASKRAEIKTLSREHALIEERTGARAGQMGQLFSLTPQVADIAKKYALHHGGVDLLVLGAVTRGGGGCACPESTLLKSLVRHLVLNDKETVILDMEAGVEHLGRATASGVDLLVVVTEPGSRSLDTAANIQALAADIGIGNKLALVLNKVHEPGQAIAKTRSRFPDVPILGTIPYDERFITCDENQISLFDLPSTKDLQTFVADTLKAAISIPRPRAAREQP